MDLLLVLGTLNVLSGVSQAGPLPADTVDDKQSDQPVKVPFSLELEPPLPDNANGASKPVVLPLRDSYGNPIPPAVLGVDPSGADYDLSGPNSNRNSNNNPKKTVFTQGINFPIPSYASGITEIHRPSDGLLPPFDSDHKPDKDGLPTSSNLPSASVPLPVNELLPPLSVPQTKDDAINEISGKALQERFGSNFNVQQLPSFINSLQQGQSKPGAPAVPGSPVSGTKFPPAPPVQGAPLGPVPAAPKPAAASDSGKYTGGFGGAPGVLGDQKEVGFGIKPGSGAASAPVAPPKPAVVVPVVTPVVAPVAAPVAPPVSPTQSPSGGKYTGGFGGPPGILVPYDQKNS